MDNEEIITQMLEGSHLRGRRESLPGIATLVGRLHDRRWRRRATRRANLLSSVVVLVVAAVSIAWYPAPEYSSYKTSQQWGTPEADCQLLHQMIEHR